MPYLTLYATYGIYLFGTLLDALLLIRPKSLNSFGIFPMQPLARFLNINAGLSIKCHEIFQQILSEQTGRSASSQARHPDGAVVGLRSRPTRGS